VDQSLKSKLLVNLLQIVSQTNRTGKDIVVKNRMALATTLTAKFSDNAVQRPLIFLIKFSTFVITNVAN